MVKINEAELIMDLQSIYEIELEKTVGDFGAGLAAEYEHTVPGHGYREITTGGWTFSELVYFLPRTKT